MSKETWIEEFYPEPADASSEEKALDHSIRKWEGALPKNTERHGAVFDGGEIFEILPGPGNVVLVLSYDSQSCALCVHHHRSGGSCRRCPIFKVTGDDCIDIFQEAVSISNPQPMIDLLKRVREIRATEEKTT